MKNEKEMLDEIILRCENKSYKETSLEDKLYLTKLCRTYLLNLEKALAFVFELASISEEQLLKEEELKLKEKLEGCIK